MEQDKYTTYDKIVRSLKNNKIVAFALIGFVVIVGIKEFIEASQTIKRSIEPEIKNEITENAKALTIGDTATAKINLHPQGYVSDFENILTRDTKTALTNIISEHEKNTSNQIAIVTVSNFYGYDTIYDFGLALSNQWGVGQKGKDNGVTIIISKTLKKVRIFTGKSLEANKLKDWDCNVILEKSMMPAFREGNIDKGLIEGVTEIIRHLENI